MSVNKSTEKHTSENRQAVNRQSGSAYLIKFETDSDRRLVNFFVVCLLLNLTMGFYFTVMKIIIPEVIQVVQKKVTTIARFQKIETDEKDKPEKQAKVGKNPEAAAEKGEEEIPEMSQV